MRRNDTAKYVTQRTDKITLQYQKCVACNVLQATYHKFTSEFTIYSENLTTVKHAHLAISPSINLRTNVKTPATITSQYRTPTNNCNLWSTNHRKDIQGPSGTNSISTVLSRNRSHFKGLKNSLKNS